MRIAFVLSYWHDRFGGPVTVVKSLGQALTAAGHDISYWALGDDEDDQSQGPTEGLHLYGYGRPHRWRRSADLVRGLSGAARSFDVLHVSELWTHPVYAASRVACTHQVPYILRPAGGLEPWSLRNGPFRRWKKRAYMGLFGKSIMQRAACLQAASKQEAENFRRSGYGGPVSVIPNGVDLDTFHPGDSVEGDRYWPDLKDRPVVLFMSRLSPGKGLDMLIPLWADLIESAPCRDAMLMVAGPDDRGYGKTLERMVERCGVGSHIRMTGMLQGERKLALLRRADVFVLPSYSENFGMVVAEALTCGTPVITTTSTPWRQLQTVDAGRWVAPTKSALTAALRELLTMSESQRDAMGQRGRALIEANYTWDKAAAKFLDMCDGILKGTPVPLHA